MPVDYAAGELQRTAIFLKTIKTALERDDDESAELFIRPLECVEARSEELRNLMDEVGYVKIVDRHKMN